MRLSGSNIAPNQVYIELDDGVKFTLTVNTDNSLTVRETTFCTLLVKPESSNCVHIIPANPNQVPAADNKDHMAGTLKVTHGRGRIDEVTARAWCICGRVFDGYGSEGALNKLRRHIQEASDG